MLVLNKSPSNLAFSSGVDRFSLTCPCQRLKKKNVGRSKALEKSPQSNFHLHYSEYDGDPNELILGDEMEYSIKCKNSKVSAERVVKLPQGTIVREDILPEVYIGRVLRSLRRADPQVSEVLF